MTSKKRQSGLSSWGKILGVESSPVSHKEKLISAVGGLVAILGILLVSSQFTELPGATLLVASMGASAVLLFAVPHGQLAQPWPLAGGHIISAIVGVSCALLISDKLLAASLAVGLSIFAMHYLRCIHPPGGATALSAVMGGASVQTLGYWFVLTPVALNVSVILIIGVLFNYPFTWRRYPVYLQERTNQKAAAGKEPEYESIPHENFVYALSQIDSFVDVTEHELLKIYNLAMCLGNQGDLVSPEIKLDSCYSNGKHGGQWSVRQVVDEPHDSTDADDMLIYKTVAGNGRRRTGVLSRKDFAVWAKYEVYRDKENWKRKTEK